MGMNLAELEPKEQARIVAVSGAAAANRRLREMGLTRGARLQVERVAPLGDPVEIKIRGYHLTLRKSEAQAVQVERMD